jgi:hypothetical protein
MPHGGPQRIGLALAELIAARGWARVGASEDLEAVWIEVATLVAGAAVAQRTRVGQIKRGHLHVSVDSSPLLGQLSGFHAEQLLAELNTRRPELRIKALKFRLRS